MHQKAIRPAQILVLTCVCVRLYCNICTWVELGDTVYVSNYQLDGIQAPHWHIDREQGSSPPWMRGWCRRRERENIADFIMNFTLSSSDLFSPLCRWTHEQFVFFSSVSVCTMKANTCYYQQGRKKAGVIYAFDTNAGTYTICLMEWVNLVLAAHVF